MLQVGWRFAAAEDLIGGVLGGETPVEPLKMETAVSPPAKQPNKDLTSAIKTSHCLGGVNHPLVLAHRELLWTKPDQQSPYRHSK